MDTLKAIYNRRSIREYTDEPVTEEEMQKLLEAAFSAPTAVNAQPWEFVVLTDKEAVDKVRNKLYFARYNAPAAIIVCGNMKLAFKGPTKDLWICDCSAAIENILLAATDMGLATVWISIYPLENNVKEVRKLLDMPDYVVPMGMVYVGHGTYELEGRCRYNEKRVYWQKYDPKRKHKLKEKPVIGHYSD
jgi:nitroreductase